MSLLHSLCYVEMSFPRARCCGIPLGSELPARSWVERVPRGSAPTPREKELKKGPGPLRMPIGGRWWSRTSPLQESLRCYAPRSSCRSEQRSLLGPRWHLPCHRQRTRIPEIKPKIHQRRPVLCRWCSSMWPAANCPLQCCATCSSHRGGQMGCLRC